MIDVKSIFAKCICNKGTNTYSGIKPAAVTVPGKRQKFWECLLPCLQRVKDIFVVFFLVRMTAVRIVAATIAG